MKPRASMPLILVIVAAILGGAYVLARSPASPPKTAKAPVKASGGLVAPTAKAVEGGSAKAPDGSAWEPGNVYKGNLIDGFGAPDVAAKGAADVIMSREDVETQAALSLAMLADLQRRSDYHNGNAVVAALNDTAFAWVSDATGGMVDLRSVDYEAARRNLEYFKGMADGALYDAKDKARVKVISSLRAHPDSGIVPGATITKDMMLRGSNGQNSVWGVRTTLLMDLKNQRLLLV